MSLNPYESPRATDGAGDSARAAISKASADVSPLARRITLVIGAFVAPLLALLAFALIVAVEGQLGLEWNGKLIAIVVPLLIGFYTLRQIAGWLDAPEVWELVSVTVWIGLTVATAVGYVNGPR